MQKRNERKKKLVCGRNGNLKISSVLHTAGTSSVRYAKKPSSSKRKKEEKKEKEATFTNFQKEPWVCLLLCYT